MNRRKEDDALARRELTVANQKFLVESAVALVRKGLLKFPISFEQVKHLHAAGLFSSPPNAITRSFSGESLPPYAAFNTQLQLQLIDSGVPVEPLIYVGTHWRRAEDALADLENGLVAMNRIRNERNLSSGEASIELI